VKTESGRERIDGREKNKKKIEMSLEKPILAWKRLEFEEKFMMVSNVVEKCTKNVYTNVGNKKKE